MKKTLLILILTSLLVACDQEKVHIDATNHGSPIIKEDIKKMGTNVENKDTLSEPSIKSLDSKKEIEKRSDENKEIKKDQVISDKSSISSNPSVKNSNTSKNNKSSKKSKSSKNNDKLSKKKASISENKEKSITKENNIEIRNFLKLSCVAEIVPVKEKNSIVISNANKKCACAAQRAMTTMSAAKIKALVAEGDTFSNPDFLREVSYCSK